METLSPRSLFAALDTFHEETVKRRPGGGRRRRRPQSASAPSLGYHDSLFEELDEVKNKAKKYKGNKYNKPLRKSKSLRCATANKNRSLPWGSSDGELAWRGFEEAASTIDKDINRVRSLTSEGKRRVKYHNRTQVVRNKRLVKEKKKLRAIAKRRKLELEEAARDALFETTGVRPSPNETGGLDGKELKNWKQYMDLHCRIIKTAKPTMKSRLPKFVEHRRKDLKKKRLAKRVGRTLNDGDLGGPKLLWWRKQRALHDRVVGGATARVSQELPKHVKEEIEIKEEKLKKKYANWKLENGGLVGSAKIHWDHMRELHERVVGDAKSSVSTKLPKHVREYREYLKTQQGARNNETLHGKIMREMHEKVIAGAKNIVHSKLPKHVENLRDIKRKKHNDKFKNFNPNDGGLEGKARLHWRIMKKQQKELLDHVSPKIHQELPKHVRERGKELERRRKMKYENWRLEDGGLEGTAKLHWRIMRQLHDEIVGTASKSVSMKLDKHVEHYRDYLKKRSKEKFNNPDNAGLTGKELKHWQILLETHNKVVAGAEVQTETTLPQHVKRLRKLKHTKLKRKIENRTPEDGGLEGKELAHWNVMKELHEHIVNKAAPAVDTKHEKHVIRYANHVKAKSKKKFAEMHIDDGLLEGRERDWWRKQREVHEGIVGRAKSSVDNWYGGKPDQRDKNELRVFPRRVESNETKLEKKREERKITEAVNAQNVVEALKIVEEYKAQGLIEEAKLTPRSKTM